MIVTKPIIRIALRISTGLSFLLFTAFLSFAKPSEQQADTLYISATKPAKIDSARPATATPAAKASDDFFIRLARAAEERTRHRVRYNPAYVKLAYPGGDVPKNTGVCSDVVIRAYRRLGIDLQVKVHEDMRKHFAKYPKIWGLKSTDTNIDHRRVPNLMVFFQRHGIVLDKSPRAAAYAPGDIVTWDLGGGTAHIGIVSSIKIKSRYAIVHNIGAGPKLEDVLFNWKITGHYRYKASQ